MKWIDDEIEKLKEISQFRSVPELDFGADKFVYLNGKKLLNMASNNYLGFSGVDELAQASIDAVKKYGCSSGASRIVTGNFSIYDELEKITAEYKGTESALVFNSGYSANMGIFSSLADRETVVFSDKLNHASIIDGINLSGAKHVRFKHCDYDHLEYCLKKYMSAKRKIIVTDSIFSMDGDRADLVKVSELAEKYDALSVVDDAHATGVFMSGLVKYQGLSDRIDVQMGTFSKGLGSFGGYVAGSKKIIDLLVNKGRSFIFTTSLPPAVIGANIAAIKKAEAEKPGIELMQKAEHMNMALVEMGYETAGTTTQIIPVILRTNELTLRARDYLLEKGVLVGGIRPPTVPQNTSRLRVSLRNDITINEIDDVLNVFKTMKGDLL